MSLHTIEAAWEYAVEQNDTMLMDEIAPLLWCIPKPMSDDICERLNIPHHTSFALGADHWNVLRAERIMNIIFCGKGHGNNKSS